MSKMVPYYDFYQDSANEDLWSVHNSQNLKSQS